ncbi:Fumarylacetoacetase [Aureobasidium pullulans]|nr:Fumarylacetoacetase [Aureobasidium pullulans]
MALKSWLSIAADCHFSLANIPFGIISTRTRPTPRPAIAIGDYALDLDQFSTHNGFAALSVIQPHQHVFSDTTLNAFAGLGRPMHTAVRKYLQSVFLETTPFPDILKDNTSVQEACLIPLKDVKNHVPMQIGDYTDFYAGLNHAFTVGELFRGASNALQPNYKHLPVGYHGRASSIVVSGTPVRRPLGQILEDPTAEIKKPILSACRKLDIELELGAFICKNNNMGEPIPIDEAPDYIFGVVLLNDWSARDIQAWEYVPLGPFTAKNFASSISPWVVLTDTLEPYRTSGLDNDVEVLDYLKEKSKNNVYDIKLEVELRTSSGATTTISRTSGRNLLFSFNQMLTHHSITGCPMRIGDMLGSGTISGTEASERGSLLEQNRNSKTVIKLEGGEQRVFLEDGDEVTIRGVCIGEDGLRVGFGECKGNIIPAVSI